MKRRILALLLAALMMFSVLTACGSNPDPKPSNAGNNGGETVGNFVVPEGGYDGSEVTIKFYHTMGANIRNVLDTYIVEFNKLYPNIHIEHEQVGSYDDVRDQISKEITVNGQPNIAYCYPDHVALYNITGTVTALDSLIASEVQVTRADGTTETLGLTAEQIADFVEGYYNEGKQFGDGLMYTMPMSKSTEVLYYNVDFFKEHNLTVPKTWDEMEAVCAQIKKIDPTCSPLGYDSAGNWFITMCEQSGSPYTSATGDHFLFDNETNRAFIKRFNDWFQKGYVITQDLYGTYTSSLFTGEDAKTKSYMCIGSSAGATHQRPDPDASGKYPFEVGITTIPQMNAANPKVISQGPSLCIFQKANPQEVIASWLFVKFLTTNVDFQVEFGLGSSGYMPVIKSAVQHPVFANELAAADGGSHITALVIKVAMEQEKAYYTSPAFNGSSTARDQVGFLLNACLPMKGDDLDAQIADAFEKAIDECEYMS